jgi:hypothetical protein
MHRKFRSAQSCAIPTLVLFVFYQSILLSLFGSFGFIHSEGLQFNDLSKIIPFYGIYQNIIKPSRPIILPELLNMIFLIIIPSLLSWYVTVVKLLKGEVKPAVFYLLLNVFSLTFLPSASYVEIIAYGRLSIQLVSAFIPFDAMTKNQRLLNFSLL